MRTASIGSIVLGLALSGIGRGGFTEDNPFDTPYRYYNYGDWIDEDRFNLDYEMRVPGYTYEGDMVFADYPHRDYSSVPVPEYPVPYGSANGDWNAVEYDGEDWYDDDYDDDTGWYDYDPITDGGALNWYATGFAGGRNGDGERAVDHDSVNGNGDADADYDYYTSDWYVDDDSFTEWYDSL
jgi:hypothetical protein